MICKKPFKNGSLSHGCGQCLPCRINLRRLWTSRVMLEKECHRLSSFITLTYSDEHLPKGGTLVRKHITDWLKRLRESFPEIRIRYYGVGEYGDQSHRPHYHVCVFGIDCLYPQQRSLEKKNQWRCECFVCSKVRKTWGMGRISVDALEKDSAQYVAGYVTKKMTNPNNEKVKEFLKGRYKEFPFMSLKPGIGALFVPSLVVSLLSKHGAEAISNLKDVPISLKNGVKQFPIGRYLRSKLIKEMGYDEELLKKERLLKHSQEMLLMHEKAQSEENGYEKWAEEAQQKIKNIEARYNVFSKKGSI